MKKMTFKDIKELSGLSIGTISRYFNKGPVSQKNKQILDKIVTTHNYTPNTAAQNLKLKPKDVYVLIPSTSSHSNYLISSGIIQNYKDVICVSYDNNFTAFKEKFLWVLGTSHIGIIIFPPFNQSDNVSELINNYHNENIVLYDLSVANFGCVNYSINSAITQIYNNDQHKILDFVYVNKQDHNFATKKKLLELTFLDVDTHNINSYYHNNDNLTLFQYNDLLEKYHKFNWINLIMISKDYNWKIMPKYWIEINFYEIGLNLINLILTNQKDQVEIAGKLHINYYQSIYESNL